MKLELKLSPQIVGFVAVAAIALLSVVFLSDSLQDALFSSNVLAVLASLGSVASLTNLASQSVIGVLSSTGYAGVFSLMFLESTSLPIPSEVILPFSGYLVSVGRFDLITVILISTLAGTAGSAVDYWIGMRAGKIVGSRVISRLKFVDQRYLMRAEKWFKAHEVSAVVLTRMLPGARTLVSFPAGAARMNFPRFLIYSTLGCFGWSTILIYVGVILGNNWELVGPVMSKLAIVMVAVIFAAAILWLVRSHFSKRLPTLKQDSL